MPEVRDSLNGEAVSVHDMLVTADRRFRAPEFQRHYVWTDDQIGRFWGDIKRLRDEGVTETGLSDTLFLGAMVLQVIEPGGPGSTTPLFSIIDGQQRLTTLYLVFTALAEAFQDTGHPELAEDVERQYLLVQASMNKGHPRLEPTTSDTAQFYKIISCLQNPPPTILGRGHGPEEHFMWRAWRSIRHEVRELCADTDDHERLSVDKLQQLLKDIAGNIDLVSITLGTRHDPHEVYERLNTAGERLGHIDLIRNAVFLTAGAGVEATAAIYQHWENFEGSLGREHQRGYFYPYALIRDPQTTNASLYRSLRTYWEESVTGGVRGREPAKAIIDDLTEYLPAYRAIVGDWRPPQLDPDAWSTLQRLGRLNPPTTMYPYLMRLVHEHLNHEISTDDFSSVIGVIDSFIIRRFFCELGNTGIHPVFKRLWSSVGADKDALIESLNVRTIQFPDDEQFRQYVLYSSIYGAQRCRYVLTEYERSFTRGDPSEWHPDDVTVDHLMPQKANLKEWPGVTLDAHKEVVDTFANLVPLSRRANSEKSDRSWVETRKMMLEESGTVFKSTRAVFDEYDHWDLETIRQRAERLADWALDRWPKG